MGTEYVFFCCGLEAMNCILPENIKTDYSNSKETVMGELEQIFSFTYLLQEMCFTKLCLALYNTK